jgi:predicted Zn finger-like uncharacterized protein
MLLACPNCTTTYDVKPSVIGEDGRSLRCARCQTVWFATRSQELPLHAQTADAFASTGTASHTASGPPRAAGLENDSISPPAAQAENAARELSAMAYATAEKATPSIDAPPLAPLNPNISPPLHTPALTAEGEDIETFARRRAQASADRAQRIRAQFGTPAIIAILAVIVAALLAWRVTIVQHAPQMASLYASIGLPINLRGLAFGEIKTTKETRDGVPTLLVEGAIISKSRFPLEVPRLRFALRNSSKQEIYSWTAMPEQSILTPGATLPFHSRLPSPPSEGHDVVVRFFTKLDATEGAR